MPMIHRSSRVQLLGAVVLAWQCSALSFAQVSARERILQSVDSGQMQALRGNVPPLARPEFDQGEVDGAIVLPRVTLFFKPTADQQADLDAVLDSQQDRSSPNYHRWLTPEEYGERFGLNPMDIAKVVSWLQSQGLTVLETARGRNWVAFSGTARQVSAAFHTSIHRYAAGGETHFANATEPSLPVALANVAGGLRGLNDFRLRAAEIRRSAASVEPNFTSGVSGRHFVTPGDFATIYDLDPLYNNGIDGTGQKIAVAGQTDINLSDIAAFRAASGLLAKVPQVVLIGTDPGVRSSDINEASLDVEWAGAVAKNATIVYVNSMDVIMSMQSAINQNLAPVISISYGGCEQDFGSYGYVAELAEQANAQGITIVASSGDDGAADCDSDVPATQGLSVGLPASLPYVTAVGGTEFNEGSGTYWQTASNGQDVISSALSYIPEVAWNQTGTSGELLATGGGASALFSKPIWQAGIGVPNDSARDVPDVSFDAAPDPDGYLICAQGWCTNGFRNSAGNLDEIGGTSGGTPTFAGVVALINQQTQSAGQGNINYILYPLAASSSSAFHDITVGNNSVPCQPGSPNCPASAPFTMGYNAGTGYDLATGLGSPDVNSMVTAWTSVSSTSLSNSNSGSTADFQLAISPASLVVTRGDSATAQITVTSLNGFGGNPTFACSVGTALTGVTCTVTQGMSANTFTLKVIAPAATAIHRMENFDLLDGWPIVMLILALAIFYSGMKRRWNGEPANRMGTGQRPRLAPVFVLATVLLIAAGCGGSSGSNPSGNSSGTGGGTVALGSVGVTGTSGSISHTTQISITVN